MVRVCIRHMCVSPLMLFTSDPYLDTDKLVRGRANRTPGCGGGRRGRGIESRRPRGGTKRRDPRNKGGSSTLALGSSRPYIA